jgi:hypothetical protein
MFQKSQLIIYILSLAARVWILLESTLSCANTILKMTSFLLKIFSYLLLIFCSTLFIMFGTCSTRHIRGTYLGDLLLNSYPNGVLEWSSHATRPYLLFIFSLQSFSYLGLEPRLIIWLLSIFLVYQGELAILGNPTTKEVIKPSSRNLSATAARVFQCTCPGVAASRKDRLAIVKLYC